MFRKQIRKREQVRVPNDKQEIRDARTPASSVRTSLGAAGAWNPLRFWAGFGCLSQSNLQLPGSGRGFPSGSVVNNLRAIQETRVQFLSWEQNLGEEMTTHSSILARIITCTEGPGGLQSTGLQSRTQQNNQACVHTDSGRKKCGRSPVFSDQGDDNTF